MNTFEVINARHSYRGSYKPVQVPREDLMKIMQAGLAAPSGCNKQTTSLIAVDDPEVLRESVEFICGSWEFTDFYFLAEDGSYLFELPKMERKSNREQN